MHLRNLQKKFLTAITFFIFLHIDENFGDEILRKSDKTPNSNGLKLLGIDPYTNEIIDNLSTGKVKLIFILNDDITSLPGSDVFLENIETSIQLISNHNKYSANANVILPTSTYAEVNGTFVNFQNRIQRLRPAVTTLENERLPGEFAMSRLDKFGAPNDRWTHGTKFNSRPGWKILKLVAKTMGHEFAFENSEEVFEELCSTIPEMNGYDYDSVGHKGIILGEKPLVEAE